MSVTSSSGTTADTREAFFALERMYGSPSLIAPSRSARRRLILSCGQHRPNHPRRRRGPQHSDAPGSFRLVREV